MSAEKQETIADIIAEMRYGTIPKHRTDHELLTLYAYRISTAWKLERDELVYSFDPQKARCSKAPDPSAYAIEGMKGPSPIREEGDSGNPECLKKDNWDIVPQRKSFGNAAATREALEKLHAEIVRFYANEWIPYDAWQGCDEIISNALSAPSRNCDLYNTPEESIRIFESYIRSSGKIGFINPFTEVVKWLLAIAADRKGDNDGSK